MLAFEVSLNAGMSALQILTRVGGTNNRVFLQGLLLNSLNLVTKLAAITVADPGGAKWVIAPPPGPVKISPKQKMTTEGGRIDFMFLGPLTYPATGFSNLQFIVEQTNVLQHSHQVTRNIQ